MIPDTNMELDRQYLGIDELGNATEVVNGVYYYGGLPEDRNLNGLNLNTVDAMAYPEWRGYEFNERKVNVCEDVGTGTADVQIGAAREQVRVESDVVVDNAGAGDIGEEVIVVDGLYSDDSPATLVDRVLESDGEVGGVSDEEECPGGPPEPQLDMEFEFGEEFIAYFHRYARSARFGARIRDSQLGSGLVETAQDVHVKNGKFVSIYQNSRLIKMVSRKEGKFKSKSTKPNRSTQTCKTGCPYMVTAIRNPKLGDPWRITKIANVHNHDIDVSASRYLPRYRRINKGDQMTILQLHRASVKTANIFDIFVNRYKGYDEVPFTECDLRNFVHYSDKQMLKESDFGGMEVHFKRMREETPGFFYEYDVDEKTNRLKSVFWADARCREAFKEFGDVVSFDTTYVSNRYRMPFAPFVGVNHQGRTILFGCALLGSEVTESFVWLFTVWKKCMRGVGPVCILTDQDRAIGKAIHLVFPNAKHRWCLWHVMRNCSKSLGMNPEWRNIYKKLQALLHDSYTVEDFESDWKDWVTDFGLESYTWVTEMFKERSRWAPVYFKSELWAGMSSTQRSEGMNHYFKGFVNVNTSLKTFVEKYAKAICRRIEGEDTKCFHTGGKRSRETTRHAFEGVFEKLLTRDKFLEFHDELVEMNENVATKVSENGCVVEYDVLVKHFRPGWSRRKNFKVSMNRSSKEVICECKNFEFRGILCAHALRVFWMEDTYDVPERYVFRRWRKDIPRKYMTHVYPLSKVLGQVPKALERYEEMNKLCEDVSVMVLNDEELQKEALVHIARLKKLFEKKTMDPQGILSTVKDTVGKVYRTKAVGVEEGDDDAVPMDMEEVSTILDPIDKRGRGRPPLKRKKSAVERRAGTGRSGRGKGKQGTEESSDISGCPIQMVCQTWEPATPPSSNTVRTGVTSNNTGGKTAKLALFGGM